MKAKKLNVMVKSLGIFFIYRHLKHMQCVYFVGIKHIFCFYYNLQPMWWLALDVTTFFVVVMYSCLLGCLAFPMAKNGCKAVKLGHVPKPLGCNS